MNYDCPATPLLSDCIVLWTYVSDKLLSDKDKISKENKDEIQKSIEENIVKQIKEHLWVRFCKELMVECPSCKHRIFFGQKDLDNDNWVKSYMAFIGSLQCAECSIRFDKILNKNTKLNSIFKENIFVGWYPSNKRGNTIKKIKSQKGSISVILNWVTADDDDGKKEEKKTKRKDFVLKENTRKNIRMHLRKRNPDVLIEFFTIVQTIVQKINPKEDYYHLASRVCAAFVEYTNSNITVEKLSPLKSYNPLQEELPPQKERIIKVLDVRDAIDLVCNGLDGSMQYFPPVPNEMLNVFEGNDTDPKYVSLRYKFPFGVWFRGLPRVCYNLMPSLFYKGEEQHCIEGKRLHPWCKKELSQAIMYDETSMVNHFMLHESQIKQQFTNPFEWLCLMQHYGLPTRLLDWSENILIALFWAVEDANIDCDGAIWVLNAGRLNQYTRIFTKYRNVCFPEGLDVILRSAMATTRTGKGLRDALIRMNLFDFVKKVIDEKNIKTENEKEKDEFFIKWLDGEDCGKNSIIRAKLAYPIAVFPGRTNDRIIHQHGTFTLHGGKKYDPVLTEFPKEEEKFPSPVTLDNLSRQIRYECPDGEVFKQFLDVYVVPSCAKRKIREQLKRLGIHVASVYPELEHQAKYIKSQWLFGDNKSKEDCGSYYTFRV